MSYKKGDEIHIEDDDAMAGSKTGHVRWILGISLFVAIALLSAIWIFGAWSQGNVEEEATQSAVMQDNQDAQEAGDSTDSIVLEAGEGVEGEASDAASAPETE
ncbi:hypothetical protein [Aurantiacibacter marinus]|uniref:Uncharacterized protein n=1 Tax=Aurantiacibacter marinus TaxID=874156 RepID=A0A0H0XKU5_9SPHN|nr:hypothetical protein [Aurantiacibacter marinus]KLI62954.1 hypothetical protein AAV99_12965 [Aurantiacibacter marinus]